MKKIVDFRLEKALDRARVVYTRQQVKRVANRLRNGRATEERIADLAKAQQDRAFARYDARLTHLAHMFLKGKPLAICEDPKLTNAPVKYDDLLDMVSSVVDEVDLQKISATLTPWFDAWLKARGA
jgi:hypothetical protein